MSEESTFTVQLLHYCCVAKCGSQNRDLICNPARHRSTKRESARFVRLSGNHWEWEKPQQTIFHKWEKHRHEFSGTAASSPCAPKRLRRPLAPALSECPGQLRERGCSAKHRGHSGDRESERSNTLISLHSGKQRKHGGLAKSGAGNV